MELQRSISDRLYSQLACLLQVCFNFKQQQTILCLLQNQSENLKAVRNGQHLELGKDVIDIRIAQFLLTPNSPNVTDSPELDTVLQEVAFPSQRKTYCSVAHGSQLKSNKVMQRVDYIFYAICEFVGQAILVGQTNVS